MMMGQIDIDPLTATPEFQAQAFLHIARQNNHDDDTELVARLTRAFALADSQSALLAACELLVDQYQQVCDDNNVMGWPAMIASARAAVADARLEASDAD